MTEIFTLRSLASWNLKPIKELQRQTTTTTTKEEEAETVA